MYIASSLQQQENYYGDIDTDLCEEGLLKCAEMMAKPARLHKIPGVLQELL